MTVSIGIPAHNESKTIQGVLLALKDQKQTNFSIKEIIVVSDGSTDGTENEVNKVHSPLIHFSKNTNRLGLAKTINKISEQASGDILVILNADIYIKDDLLISKLIQPLIENTADLVAGNIQNTAPKGLVEKILSKSSEVKEQLYRKINNGHNVYTLHGPVRAFQKHFYKSFQLIEDIADDMYTYYYAKEHGYRYKYVQEASVYYKLPETISDHVKQSIRFISSFKNARNRFGSTFFPNSMYEKLLPLFFIVNFFIKNPIYCILYIGIQSIVCFRIVFGKTKFSQHWDIINSSKLLYEF